MRSARALVLTGTILPALLLQPLLASRVAARGDDAIRLAQGGPGGPAERGGSWRSRGSWRSWRSRGSGRSR
jgi:hypothetical protein